MFLSVFDLFKIGIGPSSSHTVGPMVAAARYLDRLRRDPPDDLARLRVSLHGSLAFTGHGHATDTAVILGLLGEAPDTVDPDAVPGLVEALHADRTVYPDGLPQLRFDPLIDLVFDRHEALPGHVNGLRFEALDDAGTVLDSREYYSVGGGFVLDADELRADREEVRPVELAQHPHPFASAVEMLSMGEAKGLSIAQMKRENECVTLSEDVLDAQLDRTYGAMRACMDRGLSQDGTLPGGLSIKRRAKAMYERLGAGSGHNVASQHALMDWLSVYAMAVNEENAAGGRVVTAPTNGAAGVIPAVLRYYESHCEGADQRGVRTFLLTAAAIGGIIKHNASISGAEVGCQGEVGSASAMAAAGLCAALGGHNAQVENAAEIALEHHLGMTCDPIGGLVQVPCIERNAFGAVKAVTAASMALHGDGQHFVPLDSCIETMRQTGLDMSSKYKETAEGGLAINVVAC